MLVSAELRWFWQERQLPPGLDAWFRSGPYPPGGGTPRKDAYLHDPDQRELGVKTRGQHPGLEIKGLVAVRPAHAGPFAGRVQIWTKWTSHALTLDGRPRILVGKTRWLRKFDTADAGPRELPLRQDEGLRDPGPALPEHGCNLELVALQVDGDATRWWTLAFEAFGPLDTVERSLAGTLAHVPAPPSLAGGVESSYPEWLATLPRARERA